MRGGGGRGRAIDQGHVFELIVAGRKDAGALVDLLGIEQVEDGKVLYIQHLVHALDAEAALAVEEVGNVGLLETGLAGQAEAGQLAGIDALPERLAQSFLQSFEFHGSGSLYHAKL